MKSCETFMFASLTEERKRAIAEEMGYDHSEFTSVMAQTIQMACIRLEEEKLVQLINRHYAEQESSANDDEY